MNLKLLQPKVQDYFEKNWNIDAVPLLLKKPIFEGISQQELVSQLECKRKAKDKLPTWFGRRDTLYPTKLNIEQTSSELTAVYKSELVGGTNLLDVTGGFGVDSFYFSKKIEQITHCEINASLGEIVTHNFSVLGCHNIDTIVGDGLRFAKTSTETFDWIYLDPSRRDDTKKKVFQLKDYQPNVPKNLDSLFEKTQNILLKTSPILDITQGLKELHSVKEIHVVAVKNEVKELLWVLQKGFNNEPLLRTVNLLSAAHQKFDFYQSEETNAPIKFANPKRFLYEPNPAILKSGSFKLVGNRYGLKKLAEHSHLYTSKELIDFPGRVFEVNQVLGFNKREIKKLGIKKANITTRNFPLSVSDLRKELRIADGGVNYCFFTTNAIGGKILILTTKLGSSGVNPK